MGNRFRIYDANSNEQYFTFEQTPDMTNPRDQYLMEMSQEKSAGGDIKQQIRPGLRFHKIYEYRLEEADYITFLRLLTNNADAYFIEYTTTPDLLNSDAEAITKNNFKIVFNVGDLKDVVGNDKVYIFDFELFSASLM